MATQPKRMSAEDRRSQVLDAAMDLFARQGYRGTTTRQIADHAGVNEAIIFRHFASKEELYWAILIITAGLPRAGSSSKRGWEPAATTTARFSPRSQTIS